MARSLRLVKTLRAAVVLATAGQRVTNPGDSSHQPGGEDATRERPRVDVQSTSPSCRSTGVQAVARAGTSPDMRM